jgi:hypothetical protein
MKTIKINNIELNEQSWILIQEPTQHFSHDCLKVEKIEENKVEFSVQNGGSNDGTIISYTIEKLTKCKIQLTTNPYEDEDFFNPPVIR